MTRVRNVVERLQYAEVYNGSLAEDYDGIGQYVTVAMNRSSTAAALRVRVTAGDIGMARPFPTGTPVLVYAERGQLRILSLGGGGGAGLVYHSETSYDAREPQDIVLTGIDGLGLVESPHRIVNGFNIYPIGIISSELIGSMVLNAGRLRYPIINTIGSVMRLNAMRLIQTKQTANRRFK